jgi:hypothetical protein
MQSTLDVALRLARALDAAGIRYFLGGSLASSLQGDPRATNDIDIVLELRGADVDRLVTALGPDFEVDAASLRKAADERGSWNIYFLPLFTKIDLFVLGTSPFDQEEFARRRSAVVRPPAEAIVVKSPEDSVLRKLLWYRAGGEVSQKQWSDVVEVLRMNRATLDEAYLDRWAASLSLAEPLTRARADARAPRKSAP